MLARHWRQCTYALVGLVLLVGAAATGILGLGDMASAGPPAEEPAATTYRIGMSQDITTLNFWRVYGRDSNSYNFYVNSDLHPTLYRYSDQRFDWVPYLADGFPTPLQEEIVGGQTLWSSVVTLKQGVEWSDGTAITAADVVFTLRTVVDLELPGNWASVVDPNVFDHVEVLDDFTLKMYFKREPGLAQWQFGVLFTPIMQVAFWAEIVEQAKRAGDIAAQQEALYAADASAAPVAGPYRFETRVPGAYVELVRNASYFFTGVTVTEYENGAYQESKPGVYEFSAYGTPAGPVSLEFEIGPFFDKVRYVIYGSEDAALAGLISDEVDIVLKPLGLPRSLSDRLKGEPGITVLDNPSNGVRYLGFNLRKPPMDSKAFRQAIATVIDKEFVTGAILQGAAIPVYAMVPAGNAFWHNGSVPQFGSGLTRGERIAQAVQLLKEAGFTYEVEPQMSEDGRFVEVRGQGLKMPDGTPVPELEIIGPSAGYDPMRATFNIWTERWLNDIGIPARANLTGFNNIVGVLYSDRVAEELDMWILGWGLDLFPDYLEVFFHSRHAPENEGDYNWGGYSNPRFDELSLALLSETDVDMARKLAFELQAILADDLPYVTLFTTLILDPYRSDRVEYPYTHVLGGVQGVNGLTASVRPAAAPPIPGVFCNGMPATMVGTNGPDQLTGTPGDDVIVGLGGNDVIQGLGGNDVICGNRGNDRLGGGSGDDTLLGGGGKDELFGGPGDDRLFGGRGGDKLFGGLNDDKLFGGRGNDNLLGGNDPDELFGGPGDDELFGGEHDDKLLGGDGNDKLLGGWDSDELFGGRGGDELFGGANDDRLFGGAGRDKLFGGDERDELFGGPGFDRLFGGNHPDKLFGGWGSDQVFGGQGDDMLFGGRGNDHLDGDDDTDECHGGAGADTEAECEALFGIP